MTETKISDIAILPAQPLSRRRLLEVIREQLKTPDGKAGINQAIENKIYADPMGDDVDDATLQREIFKLVKDGDERFIVRSFFPNLNE